MGLGDCVQCVKYVLFTFNLIFCLFGLGMVGVGLWFFLDPHVPEFLLLDSIKPGVTGIFFMVVGSVIAILGFLGCCGAIFENRPLLVLFFVLLLLVFLTLLIAGIIFLITKAAQIKLAQDALDEMIIQRQNSSYARNQTDSIQASWKCCGGRKAEKDYTDRGHPIPESCHPNTTTTYVSCSEKVQAAANFLYISIAITCFVPALVALIGMVLSMTLCCAINA